MKNIGIVGLGDMGSGLSSNLIKAGFPLVGFDLRDDRKKALADMGGRPVDSVGDVGAASDVVFVMVLNGTQVQSVICDDGGLLETMKTGSTIIVTATIKPSEIIAVAPAAAEKGINLIDSPVSGGKSGADNGTLAMMVAAKKADFEAQQDVFDAVGGSIFHVGDTAGQGQTIKAALQGLIGSSFTAIFEAMVLGTKAGADPRTLYEVFCASAVGSNLLKGCGDLILQRKFEKTGSHIGTMNKDIGITMDLAREQGCAMFTTAAARELFQAGISRFPAGDNWSIIKILEEIAGTEVKG